MPVALLLLFGGWLFIYCAYKGISPVQELGYAFGGFANTNANPATAPTKGLVPPTTTPAPLGG